MEKKDKENFDSITSGQVALPFNENQFKDFIVSLLGKPQTITKHLKGNYEIDKDDLVSLYEVINRRIYQQNDAKLIQFRASITYHDNTTVTLNGFDHLVHYNEKLPLVSKAVHLTWQYLVKFRDKDSFEKQEIAVSFISDTDDPIPLFDGDSNPRFYESAVSFRISHTGRTWGADMEAILTKQLKTVVKEPSKFLEFFRYNSERVEYSVSASLAIITLLFTYLNTASLKETVSNANTTFWIHHYGNYIFLLLAIYFIQRITIILLDKFEFYSSPSFILLTNESIKNKKKQLASYKKKWRGYLTTIISSIILGIVANFIYQWITK